MTTTETSTFFFCLGAVLGSALVGLIYLLCRNSSTTRCPWRYCRFELGSNGLYSEDGRMLVEECPGCDNHVELRAGEWRRVQS